MRPKLVLLADFTLNMTCISKIKKKKKINYYSALKTIKK